MNIKEVPGFPNYFASDDGVIWTAKRKGGNDRSPGKIGALRKLSVHLGNRGHHFVNLDRNGKTFARAVHRLVLEAFVGPRPLGMVACHYPDHSKENNCLANLRWGTYLDNAQDNYRDRPPVTEKECRRCHAIKPAADFYKDRRASDGLHGECKQCHIALAKATRDPEKRRKTNREYMRRVRSQVNRGSSPMPARRSRETAT